MAPTFDPSVVSPSGFTPPSGLTPSGFTPSGFAFADRREPPPASTGSRRAEALRLGMWLFLGTVAMLFAAFTSAYLVRRSGSDWTRINLPAGLWLNTVVLVASSLALEAGVSAGRRRRWPAANVALAAATLFGTAFLAGQIAAWREMSAAGLDLPSGPHGAFFYLLTGVHGIHVVAALIALAAATARTFAGIGRRHLPSWMVMMDLVRTFWHFLLGLWVSVFALLWML